MEKDFMQNEQVRIPILYKLMKVAAEEWAELSPKAKNKLARMYYVWVFGESSIQTGLMSEALWDGAEDEEGNKIKPSPDHFTIPQFCGYMMLDNPKIFLKDEDVFWEMYNWNRYIIKTTPEQNKDLSKYSWGKNNLVKCSLYERYEKEKITLALKGYGILEDQTDCFPRPPKGFLETEKKYIV
jgi:hypothetical protein